MGQFTRHLISLELQSICLDLLFQVLLVCLLQLFAHVLNFGGMILLSLLHFLCEDLQVQLELLLALDVLPDVALVLPKEIFVFLRRLDHRRAYADFQVVLLVTLRGDELPA